MQTINAWRLTQVLAVFILATSASAATYQVGPTRTYTNLQAVQGLVGPGDLVEVDGNHIYSSAVAVWFQTNGTVANPITLRGIRVNGNRPRLDGGFNTIRLDGDNYLFDGFEVSGGSSRGIFMVANNLTVRDCVVHDCAQHGILGADQFSGNLTLEHVEVYNCGGGTQHHAIYMATDNTRFPNAVFKMSHCYVHDCNGGNAVKSRAGRNEIYYNWLEGALYYELELIGADPGGQPAVTLREDSDVVGNVLVKRQGSTGLMRIGGDGTGDSNGRFRLVNNTLIMGGTGTWSMRLFDNVQSLEMFNNVIYRPSGAAMTIVRVTELQGTCAFSGANNWVPSNATGIPGPWAATVTGTNPGFTNEAGNDFLPTLASAVRNAGSLPTSSPGGFPFPGPLAAPLFHYPMRGFVAPSGQEARPADGAIDIGAVERGGVASVEGWTEY